MSKSLNIFLCCSERNDRVVKRQQAKELDDLKSELNEMSDALDKARSLPKSDPNQKSHLLEVASEIGFVFFLSKMCYFFVLYGHTVG